MSQETSQQFCVRWNSHLSSLGAAFSQLLLDEEFLDATVYCDGHGIRCHRMVLASCSPYFHKVLAQTRSPEPSIILSNSIKVWQIEALMQFMYKGEVHVSPEGLEELVAAAEQLEIRGLCNREENSPLPNIASIPQPQPPPPPSSSSSSSQQPQPPTPSPLDLISDTETMIGDDVVGPPTARVITSTPLPNGNDIQTASTTTHIKVEMPMSIGEPEIMSEPAVVMDEIELRSEEENQHHLTQTQQQQQQPPPSQQQQQHSNIEPPNDSSTSSLSLSWTTASNNSTPSTLVTCALQKPPPPSLPSTPRSSVLALRSKSARSSALLPPVTITKDPLTSVSSFGSARHYPDLSVVSKVSTNHASPCKADNRTDHDTDENNCTYDDDIADIYVVDDMDEIDDHRHHHANVCVEMDEKDLSSRSNGRGQIRVKSKENLFGSGDLTLLPNQTTRKRPAAETIVPGALHFNRNTMTVFLKPPATGSATATTTTTIKESTRVVRKRMGEDCGPGASSPANRTEYREDQEDEEEEEGEGEVDDEDADEDDRTAAFDGMTIKTEYNPIDDGNYESIVCSPNVMEMYNDSEGGHTMGGDCFDDIKLDKDMIYAQPVNSPHELLQYHHHMSVDGNYSDHYADKLQIRSIKGGSLGYATVPQYLADSIADDEDDDDGGGGRGGRNHDETDDGTTLLLNARSTNGKLQKFHYLTGGKRVASMKPIKRMAANDIECNLNAMVLRSPRSNQPRTYSIDALYAALMDVKNGESIYKASRMHNVPRKTLRNWMKRWEIKSAYPMPRQLKQAAEKRKRMQLQMGGGSGGGASGGSGGRSVTLASGSTADFVEGSGSSRSGMNAGAGPSGYRASYHHQQQTQQQQQHNMTAGSSCELLQQSSHRQQSHSSSSCMNPFDTKKS